MFEFVTGVILLAVVDVCTLAHYVTELPTLKRNLKVLCAMSTPLQTCNHCMGWSRFAVLSHHRIGVLSYGCSKSASCCVRLQSHHQPQLIWEKSYIKFLNLEAILEKLFEILLERRAMLGNKDFGDKLYDE